jgi:hypothetical protein
MHYIQNRDNQSLFPKVLGFALLAPYTGGRGRNTTLPNLGFPLGDAGSLVFLCGVAVTTWVVFLKTRYVMAKYFKG